MDIHELLVTAIKKGASDVHFLVGKPPVIRIHGELSPLPQYPILDEKAIANLVVSLMNQEQKELFLKERELDFSYEIKNIDGHEERFRVNAYCQRQSLSASLRHIPNKIRSLAELTLPSSLAELANLHQGFVLVAGPTGQGKSTTLSTIINEINKNRKCHIITIEDPIEYTYPQAKAIVSQRELRVDTLSWKAALRSVLREDPDVVLIGEMRDLETIAAALTIAETGHLVFSTLHTNSAAQTIDRIIDVFPDHQQGQIRQQLAAVLSGVICQRLVPAIQGARIPALEVLVTTTAVRTSIREGKTHLIDNIIQTSKDVGMITLEEYFADLVASGKVAIEVAERYVSRPTELRRYLKK
jgi:twitching motility protein PilT